MITIDINDVNEKLFSIEIDSIEVFHRNKDTIEKYLSSCIFEFKTPQFIEEMKRTVQFILDSDIKFIRKRKIEKISQSYNLPLNINNIKSIDISFVISKKDF